VPVVYVCERDHGEMIEPFGLMGKTTLTLCIPFFPHFSLFLIDWAIIKKNDFAPQSPTLAVTISGVKAISWLVEGEVAAVLEQQRLHVRCLRRCRLPRESGSSSSSSFSMATHSTFRGCRTSSSSSSLATSRLCCSCARLAAPFVDGRWTFDGSDKMYLYLARRSLRAPTTSKPAMCSHPATKSTMRWAWRYSTTCPAANTLIEIPLFPTVILNSRRPVG
jgi:hypothetical protein